MKHLSTISDISKAYLAGFLDGDGCINAQIIRRTDYRLGFQIRVSLTFFKSTKRHWFLIKLHKQLKCGSIRKRKDGISEYTIVGATQVECLCTLYLIFN
jgi:LAGLIDADG endonuclease